MQYGYYLDGPIASLGRHEKSNFYYAYNKSGGVLFAKVYSPLSKEEFEREVFSSDSFDHPNVVKFVQSFSVDRGHIIVMPFFPRTAADMLEHFKVPIPAIATIARDIYTALTHIHERGFCFSDVKPSNIALGNEDPSKAVLVDFGATVKIGSQIIESTDIYHLYMDTAIATVDMDWLCFATTLAELAGIEISLYTSVYCFQDDIQNDAIIDPLLKNVILSVTKN